MTTYKPADYPTLVEFLNEEPIATLAVPIDDEGTIHTASMRFWHSPDTFKFYFVTDRNSEKCTLIKNGGIVKAGCVVGTYSGTPFTLQMRGNAKIVDNNDCRDEIAGYYEKRGNRNEDVEDEPNILLEFTPSWARFTDYSKGYDHYYLDIA